MGGRGSSFKINRRTGQTRTNKVKIYPLLEEDSISFVNNEMVDILQEKNHIICKSTDEFNYAIVKKNLEKINDIISNYPAISKNLKENEIEIRGATFSDNQTQACFQYNILGKEEMTIFLGKDMYSRSFEEIKKQADLNQSSGWWCKSDNEEQINKVIAHEYGHFIQKLIIDKRISENPKTDDMNLVQLINYASFEAAACKREILKIQKEKFGTSENVISEYGKENSREFFAEVFANLVTSKNPTTLAKSLDIFLKENLWYDDGKTHFYGE